MTKHTLFKRIFIFCCAESSSLHGFSLVASRGVCSPVVACWLLIVVASLVEEQGL